jgi:hypothetical protein
MTDSELRDAYPAIDWDEPLPVTVLDGLKGFACRYCIAQLGLSAREIAEGNAIAFYVYETECRLHLIKAHERGV